MTDQAAHALKLYDKVFHSEALQSVVRQKVMRAVAAPESAAERPMSTKERLVNAHGKLRRAIALPVTDFSQCRALLVDLAADIIVCIERIDDGQRRLLSAIFAEEGDPDVESEIDAQATAAVERLTSL